jgi:predicted protein tyrosine phosphatase
MISIRVCSLATVENYRDFDADYLVSFLNAGTQGIEVRPGWIAPDRHSKFYFDDSDEPYCVTAPTRSDVQAIVDAGSRMAFPYSNAKILIHCMAGVSRSPAGAFIFLCIHLGSGKESEALTRAIESCEGNLIWPNGLMVQYADDVLARRGEMIRVLDDWKNSAQMWA